MRIGLEGTFPPFSSKAPNGELVGFDVDIAKAVAAKLGLKPEFVTREWSGIIAGLQTGKFDVVVNQVGITDVRKQTLDFSPATRTRTRNSSSARTTRATSSRSKN